MKKIILPLIVLMTLTYTSCKENKKDTSVITEADKEEKKDIKDFLVYKNLLMQQNIDNADYVNISFEEQGALFSGTDKKKSYIKIPFTNIDLSKEFNFSFSFNTLSNDGRFPQGLVALIDKFSSPAKVPFLVYFPANKVSGVYGEQSLWAENYDRTKGNSREFYDSFQLKSNTTYFVSVNFKSNKIEIFINSELYASFENIKPHTLKPDHILIGAVPIGNDYNNFFQGHIHGMKIFKKALNESEIVEVFNEQPYTGVEE